MSASTRMARKGKGRTEIQTWLAMAVNFNEVMMNRGALASGGKSLPAKSVCCLLFGAPCTVRPFARNPRVLVGWPLPLRFGLDGRFLLARRRGRVCV